ncbi:type II CRISPR RNA-guided endonuclease Cas9 [Flavobacterium branchiophilum]|nr:type II CRISPR RNA-guided endonuclease Cas9 [Flavobacterium branchiophilum]
MAKILGLDLGTNSIGWAIRDTNKNGNQIVDTNVIVFPQGVGEEKGVEFSLASERTKHRSSRKLYRRRKKRKTDLLKILIENGFCPLIIDELTIWSEYKKGQEMKYPTTNFEFSEWLKINPYEVRKKAVNQIVSKQELGRALYHLCQRRGFKSGRKDADAGKDLEQYKKEQEILGQSGFKTLGEYYFDLFQNDKKVRKTKFSADDQEVNSSRISYIEEFNILMKAQNVSKELADSFFDAIFFQRPLKSQKGSVGKCTLEKTKTRCPISHPLFEEFRMFQYLNSIKIKERKNDKFVFLSEYPEYYKIAMDKFYRVSAKNFKFLDISKSINTAAKKNSLVFEFNYNDKYPIVGSPTISKLIEVFDAEDWTDCKKIIISKYKKQDNKTSYELVDELWHTLFFSGDFVNDVTSEKVKSFIRNRFDVSEERVNYYEAINLKQGYSSLSKKAIGKILPFLENKIIYPYAVFFANVDVIIGKDKWEANKEFIQDTIVDIISNYKAQTLKIDIVNGLVGDFIKESDNSHLDYILDEIDKKNVSDKTKLFYGKYEWDKMPDETKNDLLNEVEITFQEQLQKRRFGGYFLPKPRVDEIIKDFLIQEYKVSKEQADKLYHPSAMDAYPQSQNNLLGLPFTKSIKNPMAMRTLFYLRKLINTLLKEKKIAADTKIIIELARELNDKNKRLAIERWQRERENENKKYREKLEELAKDTNSKVTETDVIKYRLCQEQNGICFYTNNTINCEKLIGSNPEFDIEHTFPRSKSFDNSLANKTLAYKAFNQIKGNRIPQEINEGNYKLNFINNIKDWQKKIDELEEKIEQQKYFSKVASTVEQKNRAIQQRHYLKLELDYWKQKVYRFTATEIKPNFKNSQLVDTGIITKYSELFLKSLFYKVFPAKGTMVADVRKSWGLGIKDRNYHYHHAIDAVVLTCMDKSIRHGLAEAFKESEENRYQVKFKIEKPWQTFTEDVNKLKENIIVVHKHKDKIENQTKKKLRKTNHLQPKVDFKKDEKGNNILDEKGIKIIEKYYYQTDKYGNLIPQKGRKIDVNELTGKILGVDYFKFENDNLISFHEFVMNKKNEIVYKKEYYYEKGQGIRASLHKDTFYGAIERENDNEEKEIWFVIRKPVTNAFTDAEVNTIVDDGIKNRILKHGLKNIKTPEGWILLPSEKDGKGNEIKEMLIKKIRVKTSNKNLPKIKSQSHVSQGKRKEYKEHYYATLENIFAMAIYETVDNKGKRIQKYKTISAFDLAKHNQGKSKLEVPVEENIKIENKKESILVPLSKVLRVNQMALFYENSAEEIKKLSKTDINKRLFKITQFESDGRIQLRHHAQGGADKDLIKESSVNFEKPVQKLRISLSNVKAIFEGQDFILHSSGKIDLKY